MLPQTVFVDDDIEYLEDLLDFTPLFYFKDPQDFVQFTYHIFSEKWRIKEGIVDFPRHIMFLNLQCLRCGLCCKNYETPDVVGNLALKIEEDERYDLLTLVDQYVEVGGGVSTNMDGSCRACRKVRNKPYFYCRLNDYKNYLLTCRDYLCSKSIPISNINYSSIDELINKIGLDRYVELIKTDWGEEFDWSKSANKTRIKKIVEKEREN